MEQTQMDKMQILMKHMQLPDNMIQTYFQNSSLKKLQVFKGEKKWRFYIQLENTLPAEVYTYFVERLGHTFQSIATIELYIETKNNDMTSENLLYYWQLFIQSMTDLSPAYKDYVTEQVPRIEDSKIIIAVRNEAESHVLEKRLTDPFKHFCEKIGRVHATLHMEVQNEEEAIQQFKEAQAIEDQKIAMKTVQEKEKRDQRPAHNSSKPLQFGSIIQDDPMMMEEIEDEEHRATVQGYIFSVDIRKLRSGRSLLLVKATDYTDSLEIKMFSRGDEHEELFQQVKEGMWIKARGRIQTDMYSNQLAMMANDLQEISVQMRVDDAPEGKRRVELHAHTTMSQLDAVSSPTELIEQAAAWGHEAIAITDHANVQAFPDAHAASQKNDIKVIYGVEANLVDDGVPIAYNEKDIDLATGTYVVFDVETTGLSAVYDTIIEIAGVKMNDGEIVDEFESFANPHRPLPDIITEITGITDDMLVDAPEVDEVLHDFYAWIGDSVLVAHNASFDMGFLNNGLKRIEIDSIENAVIDTLELARLLLPDLGNHRLNTLCKKMDIELTQHHRAIYDARATGYLFWKFLRMLLEDDITNHNILNEQLDDEQSYQHGRPHHATILVQNEVGLKNLYKIISKSHIDYFYRVPRVPRSLLQRYREGLLIGSACDSGEVFETMMQKSQTEAEQVAHFYDFIEVQPPANYIGLIERGIVQNEAQLLEVITNVVDVGKSLDKRVVATGNVHYIHEHEQVYRQILLASQKGNPLSRQTLPETHFRTTNEMLSCFNFLGEELAREIVVTNSLEISNSIEEVAPLKSDLYTPNIDGAEEEVRTLVYKNAKDLYGEDLPEIVVERIEKELKSIIGHGFAVIYLISHKLVKQSLIDGYLVGSRGSVGSSFVATMTEITEVNPLPAHYICKNCHINEFYTDGTYASGYDLPDKNCPTCNEPLIKDGQDIPFETFLGFKGDKVPDIDLNFSGEYQALAHNYTKELFGEEKVFRAGTIGTIAERTAYGYVKGYATDKQLHMRNAEIDRLVHGCTGVKRTTGQHPGGIIVVPDDYEIYDFTPIQFPADDRKSEWKTTHFDFHSIEDNLLKLDILGHDDPTVIRMLQDLSGIDPLTIPIDDEEVMKIFSSTASLGIESNQIDCQVGTLGVPEFGTQFVRQMLEETKPSTFAELVIISGLSHGTDVWLGNAQELINNGTCGLPEVIGCRDDIMVYLMHQGLEASLAFKIMESVRKGRGLQDEWIEEMRKNNVPQWYIESCEKIKYMFPKAHAAAYVLMAVRIAYFKVHHPIYFYAAYFSIRARDFELDTMVKGADALRARMKEITDKGNDAPPKEKNLLTVLHVALEMYERGFSFQRVDLYASSASEFIVDGNTLIPPFDAVEGLGTNAAINIVKVREDGDFLSKEDLRERSRISKTVLEYLDQHGCLEGMAEQNQLSLFD